MFENIFDLSFIQKEIDTRIKAITDFVGKMTGFTAFKDPDKTSLISYLFNNLKFTIVLISIIFSFAIFAPQEAKDWIVQIIKLLISN